MKQKVVFIGGGLGGGGQERALTHIANAFARKGIEVYILCIFKTEIFFEIHPSIQIIWPKIDRSKINKFVYALQLIPYIHKKIKHIQPNVVICFGDWYNAYTIIATRFLKTRVFITNRMGPSLYLGKLVEFLNRKTYKYADGLIVQTNRAESIIKKKYHVNNTFIVPNAIHPINVLNRTRNKRIVTVGRLSKEKGHEILIKAFSKLWDTDWELDIIGDGNQREKLEILAKELNIENRVLFHGQRKDFSNLLGNSSIFVLPSLYEGFPNALVEAMSVPLTCVSSDCIAGPAEIIQNGINGYLFPPGDDEILANILNTLISNPDALLQIEKEAYKVRDSFNFAHIIEQYQAILFKQ